MHLPIVQHLSCCLPYKQTSHNFFEFFNTFPYFFQTIPLLQFSKNICCSCFPLLKPYNNHKSDFRSCECLFLGYSISHKGYKCISPSSRIFSSKDVLFNESKFFYDILFESSYSLNKPSSSFATFQFPSILIIATITQSNQSESAIVSLQLDTDIVHV